MRAEFFTVIVSVFALLAFSAPASGGDPVDGRFSYQGRLTDAGAPVTGLKDFRFTLWEAEEGGDQSSTDVLANSVSVSDGLFNVELDFGTLAFDGEQRWLEIEVRDAGGAGYTLLEPRQPILGTPYAIQTRGIHVDDSYRVGMGTTAPAAKLEVLTAGLNRAISGTNNQPGGAPVGVYGEVSSNTGIAVKGVATATTDIAVGVEGLSGSTDGVGVYGLALALSGVNYGVRGHTNSPDGYSSYFTGPPTSMNYFQNSVGIGTATPLRPLHVESDQYITLLATSSHVQGNGIYGSGRYGVVGHTDHLAGRGVYGESTDAVGLSYGVVGTSPGPQGRGVGGFASATTGPNSGVYGSSQRADGHGVTGIAFSGQGECSGVYGESHSDEGLGVYGLATAPNLTTCGVYGQSESTSGIGVRGRASNSIGTTYGVLGTTFSPNGRGVKGLAAAETGTGIGVMGESNSTEGWDVYAAGFGMDYGSSSSRRWKENVEIIPEPLVKLAQLRGVYFDWDAEHGGAHDVGMIAEEVGAVLPEIVSYEENGVDAVGMDYSRTTPLLVEAVKALHAETESLHAENDAMRARLDYLEEKLEELSPPATAARTP